MLVVAPPHGEALRMRGGGRRTVCVCVCLCVCLRYACSTMLIQEKRNAGSGPTTR